MKKILVFIHIFTMLFLTLNSVWAQEELLYKNQKKSRIVWEDINTEKVLSVDQWINNQDLKDQSPNWEMYLRERFNQEKVGKVLKCVGTCKIDKGKSFIDAQYRANLYEGEEIVTFENSYIWMFLFDGTLIRLAPESSVTIVEMNLTDDEFFVFVRVNFGNVVFLNRDKNKNKIHNQKETDVLFFPLPIYESIPENVPFIYDENNLESFLIPTEKNSYHRMRLNQFIEENNQSIVNKSTYSFVVFPTGTVEGRNLQLEVITHFGEDTFLRLKDTEDLDLENIDAQKSLLTLRGMDQVSSQEIERGKWFKINARGREIEELEEAFWPNAGGFITKKIPSILIAREMMIKEYSPMFFDKKFDRLKMAKDYGYRIWEKLDEANLDLEQDSPKTDSVNRLKFLREYTRRLETSNIVVGDLYKKKLEERGERIDLKKYGNKFFNEALRKYLIYSPPESSEIDSFEKNSTDNLLWKKKYGIK